MDDHPAGVRSTARPRRVSPAVLHEIHTRAAAGEYASDIARAVGLSHTATARRIREWRSANGLPPPVQGVRPALNQELVARIQGGETYTSIARDLGVTREAISHRVRTYRGRNGADALPGAFDRIREKAAARRAAAARRKAREAAIVPVELQARERCPLYAAIAAQVPRWINAATREDIINDAYVAMLEAQR